MVYSYIYRTAYDITLVDDHWPQDMFNVVSGNTSQSWERLHAWVPSCNNGRLSYLYHSLVNFSHHILQWWSSVTLFWIGRQSERIVFGLSSCHYIPHPHKGCLAGLLFIQSIFSFLFLAFLHKFSIFWLLLYLQEAYSTPILPLDVLADKPPVQKLEWVSFLLGFQTCKFINLCLDTLLFGFAVNLRWSFFFHFLWDDLWFGQNSAGKGTNHLLIVLIISC